VNRLGRKFYRHTRPDGSTEDFRDDQILHRFGLSFDGFQGISPIRHCMEAVGKAIALGEYGASYFQSPVPRVIATHPTGFKTQADSDKFKADWNDSYAGKRGLKTIAVLPRQMEIAQVVKIPNEEAQFVESQKLAKEEIAQLYMMPMHRLQALDRATFSNIEHQDLEYAKYTLLPDLVAEEQALEKALLLPEEQETLFIRHNMDGLLRGDFKTRMEGHSIGITAGFLTRNEAREHEDMPLIDGLDEPIVPLNMGPASQLGKTPPAREAAAEG
jgi:HK97 family phage portal protein